MRVRIILLILAAATTQSVVSLPPAPANVLLRQYKAWDIRDTADTLATTTLAGLSLINLLSLCSTSQKADLFKKALFGEISGRARTIILARLAGSLAGLTAAWWVNSYRPFMRRKIKTDTDKDLLAKMLTNMSKAENSSPELAIKGGELIRQAEPFMRDLAAQYPAPTSEQERRQSAERAADWVIARRVR